GDVPVAADDELAAGLAVFLHQFVEPGAEHIQEAVFGLLALVAAGARRQVGADNREIIPVGADDAAFGVELFAFKTGLDAFGGVAQINAQIGRASCRE